MLLGNCTCVDTATHTANKLIQPPLLRTRTALVFHRQAGLGLLVLSPELRPEALQLTRVGYMPQLASPPACAHTFEADIKTEVETQMLCAWHSMTDLLELGPQLRGRYSLQVLQLGLIRHGAHEREARPGGEQRLNGLPDLHETQSASLNLKKRIPLLFEFQYKSSLQAFKSTYKVSQMLACSALLCQACETAQDKAICR